MKGRVSSSLPMLMVASTVRASRYCGIAASDSAKCPASRARSRGAIASRLAIIARLSSALSIPLFYRWPRVLEFGILALPFSGGFH